MTDERQRGLGVRWVVVCGLLAVPCLAGPKPLVRLRGVDFEGGAKARFGTTQHGAVGVNTVYAASTGKHSEMRVAFALRRLPTGPMFLDVRGMDDDSKSVCPIEITLNGTVLTRGPSAFPNATWAWKRYSIPTGALKPGRNELAVVNRAPQGKLGVPPWFLLARCCIGGNDMDRNAPPGIEEEFHVELPDKVRPVPEPLPPGQAEPSFKFRGTKGWMWTADQYLAEIPTLAQYKMNFLMNCYLSMCDIENHPWGSPECNRWWEPLAASKKRAYEEVVRACQKHGIHYCFSMNPNLTAKRICDYDNAKDLDDLWQHYAWMQGLGVKWFSICLDDIRRGIVAKGQAKGVNEIFRRLRATDPDAQMIFCPTFYWGTDRSPKARAYLSTLATDLHKDVYVFWTGPRVVTPTISRPEAEAYRQCVKHRLFIWDNYPVNDQHPTLHLGPVTGRDVDLCAVVDGYMANPLCPQNEINRIPLITIADYAYNSAAYDPARAIGQAIVHLADTPERRQTLKDLVELYPGMLLFAKGTGFNPVLTRFQQIIEQRHSRCVARLYLRHVEDVGTRLDRGFPDGFKAARRTLNSDLDKIRAVYATKYGK